MPSKPRSEFEHSTELRLSAAVASSAPLRTIRSEPPCVVMSNARPA